MKTWDYSLDYAQIDNRFYKVPASAFTQNTTREDE